MQRWSVLAPAGLTGHTADLKAVSLSLQLWMSLCFTQCCNKSRHVPAGHQQPDWAFEAAPRAEGEEQEDQTGGKPRKKKNPG